MEHTQDEWPDNTHTRPGTAWIQRNTRRLEEQQVWTSPSARCSLGRCNMTQQACSPDSVHCYAACFRKCQCRLWRDEHLGPSLARLLFSAISVLMFGTVPDHPWLEQELRSKSFRFRCLICGTLASSPVPPPDCSLGMFTKWPCSAGSQLSLGGLPGVVSDKLTFTSHCCVNLKPSENQLELRTSCQNTFGWVFANTSSGSAYSSYVFILFIKRNWSNQQPSFPNSE